VKKILMKREMIRLIRLTDIKIDRYRL